MSSDEDGGGCEQPFGFVPKRQRACDHTCNDKCVHPLIAKADASGPVASRKACAAAQLLHSIVAAVQRFTGCALTGPLKQAKATLGQVLVPPEMATGALTGLKAAFASILQVPVSYIDSALRARSSFTDSELNSRIESGVAVQRNPAATGTTG